MSGGSEPDGADALPLKVGALFAAAVSGWAIVAGVATLLWFVQTAFSVGASTLPYLIAMTLIGIVGSFLLAIPVSMVLGVIALAVIRRLNLEKWWQWTSMGALVGLTFILGLAMVQTSIAPLMAVPGVVVLFAIAGAVAGTVAWREYRVGSIT